VGEWSLSRLSDDDLEYMRGFAPTLEVDVCGALPALFFHGSPRSFDDLIFPETPQNEFLEMLEGRPGVLLAGGHTHVQQLRRVGQGVFVNPGSVGVAYDRNQTRDEPLCDPWAEYAIISDDDDSLAVEFRRVPFGVDKLIDAAREAGYPFSNDLAARYAR